MTATTFSRPQLAIMSALWDGRERTIDDIARRTRMKPDDVASITVGLIRARWLESVQASHVRIYRLGERGRKVAGIAEAAETP